MKSTISGPTPCIDCPERYPQINEYDEYEEDEDVSIIYHPNWRRIQNIIKNGNNF
jgi:hypothetical protein